MMFFTPAWLRDEPPQDAIAAYATHLQAIAPSLPSSLLDFARSPSLHDGRIQRVYGKGADLTMLLRCGDLQVGYCDVALTYRRVCTSNSDLRLLPSICADDQDELLYDELDIDELDIDSAQIVHRLLFGSMREVSLVCGELHHRVTPARSRAFERGIDELDAFT